MTACASASASSVDVTTSAETRYGGRHQDEPFEVTVGSVAFVAAEGERNDVRATLVSSDLRISDAAGVTAGAGCVQRSPTAVAHRTC